MRHFTFRGYACVILDRPQPPVSSPWNITLEEYVSHWRIVIRTSYASVTIDSSFSICLGLAVWVSRGLLCSTVLRPRVWWLSLFIKISASVDMQHAFLKQNRAFWTFLKSRKCTASESWLGSPSLQQPVGQTGSEDVQAAPAYSQLSHKPYPKDETKEYELSKISKTHT